MPVSSGAINQTGYDGRSPSRELANISTLGNNVFIGQGAGNSNAVETAGNIFMGYFAGSSNKNGIQNSFIGYEAGRYNTSASSNVFLGYNTGFNNQRGNENVFIGTQAGYTSSNGDGNVFIGNRTGYSNRSGSRNVFLGTRVGENNANGNSNVFLGNFAGQNNRDGSNNVFVGDSTGRENQSGHNNVFIGKGCGESNVDGSFNVFLGYESGQKNRNGNYNLFLGYQAGKSNDGDSNVIIGITPSSISTPPEDYNIPPDNSSGPFHDGIADNNTFLGLAAGACNNSGDNNTFIGKYAGTCNLSGHNNTFIGANAGFNNKGNNNSFIGAGCGQKISNGNNNVFVGTQCGFNNIEGSFNVCLGYQSGYNNKGHYNLLLGYRSGYNISGDSNIVISINTSSDLENSSESSSSGGTGNTVLGVDAGNLNTGDHNVFLGQNAGSINEGNQNTFLGTNAGEANTSGHNNVLVGADTNNTSGNNNVLVGTSLNTTVYDNVVLVGNNLTCSDSNAIAIGQNASAASNGIAISTSSSIIEAQSGEVNMNNIIKVTGTTANFGTADTEIVKVTETTAEFGSDGYLVNINNVSNATKQAKFMDIMQVRESSVHIGPNATDSNVNDRDSLIVVSENLVKVGYSPQSAGTSLLPEGFTASSASPFRLIDISTDHVDFVKLAKIREGNADETESVLLGNRENEGNNNETSIIDVSSDAVLLGYLDTNQKTKANRLVNVTLDQVLLTNLASIRSDSLYLGATDNSGLLSIETPSGSTTLTAKIDTIASISSSNVYLGGDAGATTALANISSSQLYLGGKATSSDSLANISSDKLILGKTAQELDSQHLLKIENDAVQLGSNAFIKVTTSEATFGNPITVNDSNLLRIGFYSGNVVNNIFIGNYAQNLSTDDSNNNIYIGHESGNNSTTIDSGKYNTVIGHNAYIGTYSNCIAIGNNVSVSQDNEIAIGNSTESVTNQTVKIGNSIEIKNDVVKLGIADDESDDQFGNLIYIRREERNEQNVVTTYPLVRIGRNRTTDLSTGNDTYRPLISVTRRFIRMGRDSNNAPFLEIDMKLGTLKLAKDANISEDETSELRDENIEAELEKAVNDATNNVQNIEYSHNDNTYIMKNDGENFASVKALNFQATSDKRLKTDIQTLNVDESNAQLNALRPVSFQWKNNQDAVSPEYGFIAQEVENVLPSLVHTDIKSGYKSMDYDKIIPLLVSTVQDLTKRIKVLEALVKVH